MTAHFGRTERLVVVLFLLGAASAAPLAESQDAAGRMAQEMALSSDRAPVGLTGDDVIAQMLQRNLLRNQQLQQYSSVRTYEIRNLEGKVAAQAVVRRGVSGARQEDLQQNFRKRIEYRASPCV